ncbi:hypothetical protein [Rhabdochromatium marinum]|uniref:hypothetical protein n=1 Tax=Rhabdochromatium marinum TaxID=48729 RepID=UPI001904C9FC|nr:hypothetical protein [Rhabdochromatium marinum]MBK1650270.1 hypothetical protein [Rhabdochromatium marinum]
MAFEYKTYIDFLIKEIVNPQIYLNAFVVGSIICYLTANFSSVPYIVPLFVQVLARSSVKFRQRHQKALVELPAQTEDPAFIMDTQGTIILSIGKTLELFESQSILNIKQLISEAAFGEMLAVAFSQEPSSAAHNRVEAFSERTGKWYEIKAKTTGIRYGDHSQKILVWFQDISIRKVYQLRVRDLLRYSSDLIASLEKPLTTGMECDHLASFLLKEYEAAFITRADHNNNLSGYAFKNQADHMVRSDFITIDYQSQAPINISRKEKRILSAEASAYASEAAFLQRHPFDPRVLEFIGVPIRNFITYNESDISIIAFNFRSRITIYEKEFFEVLVNIYRNMVLALDFKQSL